MKKEKNHKENNEEREKSRKKLVLLVFICLQLASLLVILAILQHSKAVSEFMVTKVARGIISVMGRVTSAVPFSFYEMLLYLAGIAIILCLAITIFWLVRRRLVLAGRVMLSLVMVVFIFANVYFVSAGFSYNRYQECYPAYTENLTKEQVVRLADYFLDDLSVVAEELKRDENGYVVMPYSMEVLSDNLRREYLRLAEYDINSYTPACKTIYSSHLMSEMGIYGVFFAPFGEANINGCMPVYERPFTMAHEMAHAKGVMREDEANNLALYITLTSDDPFIRYSALDSRIYTLLDAVWAWELAEGDMDFTEYRRLTAKVSPLLKQDWKSNSDYHNKYNKLAKLNEIVSKLNDIYLNLMGQKEGTGAYSPPNTEIIDAPVIDPGGNVVTDPGGNIITKKSPEYNTVQRIFFQTYAEKVGDPQ